MSVSDAPTGDLYAGPSASPGRAVCQNRPLAYPSPGKLTLGLKKRYEWKADIRFSENSLCISTKAGLTLLGGAIVRSKAASSSGWLRQDQRRRLWTYS